MSRITVQLSIHARFHPVYQEIVNYPPENINFCLPIDESRVGPYFEISGAESLFRKLGSTFFNLLKIPSFRRLSPDERCDLTHAGGHLLLSGKPWVSDFEHILSYAGFHKKRIGSPIFRTLLEKSILSKSCKKIMPWSIAAKKSLEKVISDSKLNEIEEKIEVVYPAVHTPTYSKLSKGGEEVSILFVGHKFHLKGGEEALAAFEILSKSYENVSLTMVSNVPKEIKRKYSGFNIDFHTFVPREKLFNEFYPESDIFLLPTQGDTFCLTFLEAMVFGIPIVAAYYPAVTEIVEDGKTGFITSLKPEEIADKTSILVENDTLRRKMGRKGRERVEKGRFSVERRNKKLRRIYEEAVQ